jgi:hypothetical protein
MLPPHIAERTRLDSTTNDSPKIRGRMYPSTHREHTARLLVLGHERPLMRNRKTDIKGIVARTRPECRTVLARGRAHCLHIPTQGRAENCRRCVEVALRVFGS